MFNAVGSYSCSINYVMYVELKPRDSSKEIGRAAAPLIIMQRPMKEPQYNVQHRFCENYTTWCC
jgi:hypothetical protein